MHTLRIPRSDPTDVVLYEPKTGKQWTRAEFLLDCLWPRNDIFMVIPSAGTQLWVYPSKTGEPHGDAWDLLSEADKQWCREENARLLVLAEYYPQFQKMLW